MKRAIVITFVLACVFLFASCGDKKHNGENTAKYHKITAAEAYAMMNEKEGVIYLAGGCFWGTELLMQSMNGVI